MTEKKSTASSPSRSPSPHPTHITIVGAGIAGLALALSLDHIHPPVPITITILELRHASDNAAGGFLALAPNALRCLKSIGAYDLIVNQGYQYEDLTFLSSRNLSKIGTIWNGSRSEYGFPACRVSRSIVRGTLLDMVKEKGIEVKYGVRVVGVREDEHTGKVHTSLSDGSTEETDLVVGADGIHSKLREHVAPDVKPVYSGQMGIGSTVVRAKLGGWEDGISLPAMILGKENSFALFPCTPSADKLSVFATVEACDRSREQWETLSRDKEHLLNMFQDRHVDEDWPEVVKRAVEGVDVERLSLWPFYKVPVLERWASKSGRVLLVGDAAHGIPPTGGQGAAMALEDAASLAQVIARNAEKGFCWKKWRDELSSWEARRKERVQKVVKFTGKGGDIRKRSVGWLQQVTKEWAMWAYFWWTGKSMGLSWLYGHEVEKEVA